MLKKNVFPILLSLIAVFVLPLSAFGAEEGYSPNFEVESEAVYLYNLDAEERIYEKNAHELRAPASLTKIMTCILALEYLEKNSLDMELETVTYPQYVQDYLYEYQLENGRVSLGGLIAGEELSMRRILYALMLPSANEAAMSIADHIGGSQKGFIEMMNQRAKELGAKNTNFTNSNGLFDENHVTTAEGIAIITRHAMQLPGFMEIVSETQYDSKETNKHENLHWETTNLMMVEDNDYYYPGLSGIKTGSLPEAGRCFVSTATRDGFTYLLVVMGSDYFDEKGNVMPQNRAFDDAATLYTWVFNSFKVKTLVEKGKYVAEIPLKLSMEKDFIKLMTEERFTSLIYYTVEASSVTIVPEIPEFINAPVKKGDPVGEAVLILSGEEVGRVKLLAAESVEASQMLILLERVKSIAASFWFKFAIVFIVLLIILYIVIMIIRNRNRRRYNDGSYKSRRRL